MSYHIQHQDGRWLKTCEITAFAAKENWTVVPGWSDDGKKVMFETLEEAVAVAMMLKERGFPVKLVEDV